MQQSTTRLKENCKMNGQTKKVTKKHTKRIVIKGRLNGQQRNRLQRLLNMFYTTNELAFELGVSARRIRRVYVPMGCPSQRNSQNHIMINGMEFRNWYLATHQKLRLRTGQAYCVSCKRVVRMHQPQRKTAIGVIYMLAKCPRCGQKVARIIGRRRIQQ